MSENYSDRDRRAGREGWTHHAPVDGQAYRQGVDEREGRRAPQFGGGGGGGGGGAMPVFLLLVLAPIVLAGAYFLIPIFPVAGTISVIVGFAAGWTWEEFDTSDTAWLTNILLIFIVTPLSLILTMRLERMAEERIPRYRQIRHWIRVVGLALMINELGLPTLQYVFGDRDNIANWGLLGGVDLGKLARIGLLMVIVHVIFRLLTTRGTGWPLRRRLAAPGRWG